MHDIIIIGAGPAGLSAAINAASEGLNTCVIEQGMLLGGQARNSRSVENYAEFPNGIAGDDLINHMVEQATKFGVNFYAPLSAAKLTMDGTTRILTAENYEEFSAKAVVLALGLTWRRLDAPGVSAYTGRGVYYGTPPEVYAQSAGHNIAIVGGANSGLQAALDIAKDPTKRVTILARSPIKETGSAYLVARIHKTPNISVEEGVEVCYANGNARLHEIGFRKLDTVGDVRLAADYLLIYIGGTPQTLWLDGTLAMDEKKFILTDRNLDRDDQRTKLIWPLVREPLPHETNVPGVFAIGDVALGRTKRIAKAVGDGATVISSIHQYLDG